jgi:DNA-binding response OmpR family regulator
MTSAARLLIVDDERDLAEAFAEYLTDLGYEVAIAGSAWELESALERRGADLVVLDVDLPGRSGLDLIRDGTIPDGTAVVVLTGNPDRIDRVIGLELGADDYVQKPVDPRELAARIAGVLRRRQGRRRPLVVFEAVSVDLAAARLLRENGASERLSPGEISLVRAFAENPGRVLSREELIELAPAEIADAFDRSIDSRIARLRRKLGTETIRTVRGFGYVYDPPRTVS